MDTKKCIISWIASFIAMFVLAGLWHMLIMESFYTSNSYLPNRESPMMGYIALGYLLLAALMAHIYPKGYSGGSPVKEGLKFGVLIGLLWILPHTIVLYGVKNSGTRVLILVDAIWHLVEEGVGGIIIGAIYGKAFKLDQGKLDEGKLG
jgi:hypothetical protein